jgi:threonylcarbamoyladenosine tRNA methylthiotransferase MtaB
MKVSLLTLGCKVNQSEINSIESALINDGHTIVSLSESPDICIVNTCTVTSKSDYQSRQYMRRALKTGAKIYATGCYAQLHKKEIHENVSDTITIIENKNKLQEINELCSINESNKFTYRGSRSRAFIKIQDGCNYRCSYCAIPLARGKSRSEKSENIIEEIKAIHSSGINEIVLTGIHIGLYGMDMDHVTGLNDLLREIIVHTDIPRIRLSSLEIREINDELLEIMNDKRVCRHLHIPLQSGDDTILQAMGRNYSVSGFERALSNIFNKFPEISIGTDVIVGFPGESAVSFQNTANFLIRNDFSYLHVFPYSKREHTKAFGLDGHVDEKTKNERVALIRNIGKEKRRNYMRRFSGKELDVIVEKKKKEKNYTATSGNYIKIHINAGELKQGSLIFIKAERVCDDHLVGIPI